MSLLLLSSLSLLLLVQAVFENSVLVYFLWNISINNQDNKK